MDYLTNDTELTAVADAIREKSEITDSLEWPDGFIQAIEDCETGGPELEWLWGNQITNTMSGTIDSTDDAYAGPILNLAVDGVSTQVTTTGKNLLPNDRFCRTYYNSKDGTAFTPSAASAGTVTDNGDGTFTMTAPSGWVGASFYSEILPAGKYFFKASFTGSAVRASVGYVDASTMTTVGAAYNIMASGTITRNWTFNRSVIVYMSVSSASAGTVTITQPQLELGSTATSYEPYTGGKPSPNPDYPQDILSVDDLDLIVAGKNLAIDSDTEYSLTTSNYARYDVAALKQDATAFTVSVDATVPSGQTLCLYGWDGKDNSSYGTFVLQSDGRYVVSISDAYTLGYFKKVEQLRIYSKPYTGGTSVVTKVSKCQLELGSTAMAYEPYVGTTIPLYDGTLRSLPDGTKDELHLTYLKPSKDHEGWAWYSREVVKRCEGKTFDGTDITGWMVIPGTYPYYEYTWSTTGAGDTAYTVLTSTNSRCNICKRNQFGTSSNDIGYGNTNHHMRLRYQDMTGKTGSLSDLADFFTNTPTTFVVPMQEPITTQLDPIELPIMPSENATVWCDGGSSQPTFMLEYIQNANIVISRLEDSIADLATS